MNPSNIIVQLFLALAVIAGIVLAGTVLVIFATMVFGFAFG